MAVDQAPDIVDVIGRFLHDLQRLGLEPPAAIVLTSPSAWFRFHRAVASSDKISHPVPFSPARTFADGDASMCEILVMGVKVRWPAI